MLQRECNNEKAHYIFSSPLYKLPLKVIYLCFFEQTTNNDYFKRIECYFSIDGRYSKTPLWLHFFSEALIKYRVLVEIEYFIALCEVPCHNLLE
jgi:hypothetical protein